MIYFNWKDNTALTKENYTKRLIDDEMDDLLKIFDVISIEGPKYFGKTWTALNHTNSFVLLTRSDNPNSDYQKALINRNLIYKEYYPELIDEWHSIEQIWDDIRTKCDEDGNSGKFILTGSSVPVRPENIFHSGAGRIYHFHNNNTGEEVDAIVELQDGESGAIEIKLGVGKKDEAVNNLLRFKKIVM